jgi:hypothetical protein
MHLTLLVVVVVVAWLVSLWWRPFGRCPVCLASRVAAGLLRTAAGSKKRRRGPRGWGCGFCKGTGWHQRVGSRTLHRSLRRVRFELARIREERAREAASQVPGADPAEFEGRGD